jgi:alpha-glucosidase/alpha-D-xyloside xylohydrolase
MVCAGTAALLVTRRPSFQSEAILIAGRPVEIAVAPVSSQTIRISLAAIENGRPQAIPDDGSLTLQTWGQPRARFTTLARHQVVSLDKIKVRITRDPLNLIVEEKDGRLVQQLRIDQQTGCLSFNLGDEPVLGFGEGGPQFDRRGNVDQMRSGQDGYRLRTHGGRVPVPWLIGTSGWAIFIHQPLGTFDLTGQEGRFDPINSAVSLPVDVFIVAAREPVGVMKEYARLTGLPEMPPLWSLGYLQSHRTLRGPDEIRWVARTFRRVLVAATVLRDIVFFTGNDARLVVVLIVFSPRAGCSCS